MAKQRQNQSAEQGDELLQQLLLHCLGLQFATLPAAATEKAGHLILDSLGVALCGTRSPVAQQMQRWACRRAGVAEAPVWGSEAVLPAAYAAAVNGCLIHCLEYDCVHEGAVVHPMAVVLSSLLAEAQRSHPSGRQLLCAVVAGVEAAARLGMAARRPMRFFRPAMCGALGAAVGLARLRELDEDRAQALFGICYSHISGTMQAHREGASLLPVQIGLNARAAIDALDLVDAGMYGPQALHLPLSGEHGYFNLFEEGADPHAAWVGLGANWQIEQVSYKPFASGRATHGGLDGLMQLQQQRGFAAADIMQIELSAPPLIRALIGRPATPDMPASYARLCAAWALACCARDGSLSVRHFDEQALADTELHELAAKVRVCAGDETDPNAMVPQSLVVRLQSGERLTANLQQVLGSPAKTLDRQARLNKFAGCMRDSISAPPPQQIEELVQTAESLEQQKDAAVLNRLMCPAP